MTTTSRQKDAKNNNNNNGLRILRFMLTTEWNEMLDDQDNYNQLLGVVCKDLIKAGKELEGQYERKLPDPNGVGDGCTGWLSEEELDERAYNHGTDLVYYLPQEYWN